MKELIPVRQQTIGQQEIKTVNARELHAFLESNQEFSAWIKNRIKKYNFTEGVDFLTVDKKCDGENIGFGGKFTPIDYHLSIDMAKELSMVERNEKGKKASKNRVYPIWTSCEVVSSMPGKLVKISIEGTKRSRHLSSRIRGKAAIKAAKRISHMKLFYRFQNAD